MRLFIAIPLPAHVTAALGAISAGVRRSAAHPVTWVAPERIHLTLQFLGEVEAQKSLPLSAQLSAAYNAWQTALPAQGPLSLALATVGAFPSLQRPQTIWVGVKGATGALGQLQAQVTAATEQLGFQREARPFRPHLTLGRVRREASAAQLTALSHALGGCAAPTEVEWPITQPYLYQSILTPAGAVYRELRG